MRPHMRFEQKAIVSCCEELLCFQPFSLSEKKPKNLLCALLTKKTFEATEVRFTTHGEELVNTKACQHAASHIYKNCLHYLSCVTKMGICSFQLCQTLLGIRVIENPQKEL